MKGTLLEISGKATKKLPQDYLKLYLLDWIQHLLLTLMLDLISIIADNIARHFYS